MIFFMYFICPPKFLYLMLALSKSESCTCSNDDFTPSTVYTANHKASKQLNLSNSSYHTRTTSLLELLLVSSALKTMLPSALIIQINHWTSKLMADNTGYNTDRTKYINKETQQTAKVTRLTPSHSVLSSLGSWQLIFITIQSI